MLHRVRYCTLRQTYMNKAFHTWRVLIGGQNTAHRYSVTIYIFYSYTTHKTCRQSFAVMCIFYPIETSQNGVDLTNFFPQPSVQIANMPINFFSPNLQSQSGSLSNWHSVLPVMTFKKPYCHSRHCKWLQFNHARGIVEVKAQGNSRHQAVTPGGAT